MTCKLCQWCKPEKDGVELGYVADKEHDSSGKELHGIRLILARIIEGYVAEPFCYLVRKALRCSY